MHRDAELEIIRSAQKPWDVVVVGGGATGAGCALDAASRGLSVLLLEQSDFGKGTSSRSTKLIHGGVRYLQQGNISLVCEALAERSLLLKLASDFVSPLPFIVPCYTFFERIYYASGLHIYDLLSGGRLLERTKSLSRAKTLECLPGLSSGDLRGGVRYQDAGFDDARFLAAIIEEAATLGAAVLNYARVTGIESAFGGKTSRVYVEDAESGERLEVSTKAVINAAGIFADEVEGFVSGERPNGVTLSQGIHLVFDKELMPGESALMIPKTADGRVLFVIPWLGRLLVGTTDTPVSKPRLEPEALEEEIDFILQTCAGYFDRAPKRRDIRSVFAGIRPLAGNPEDGNTAKVSREHHVEVSAPAFVTVRGGKWTTYRKMAEDAVDAAVEAAALQAGRTLSMETAIRDRSVVRKKKLIEADEALAEPLIHGFEYTTADVIDAVRSGRARHVEDVLARRTRLLFLDAAAASEAAEKTGGIIAAELGWNAETLRKEIDAFRRTAKHYMVKEDDAQS